MVWSALAFALATLAMPDQTGEQRSRIKTLGACGTGDRPVLQPLGGADPGRGCGSTVGRRRSRRGAGGAAQLAHLVPLHLRLPPRRRWPGSGPALLGVVFWRCPGLLAQRPPGQAATICLLVSETGFMGVLTAYDWVLFLLFWTLPVAPLYLLVRAFGHSQQARAATRYAAVTLVSGGLITLARDPDRRPIRRPQLRHGHRAGCPSRPGQRAGVLVFSPPPSCSPWPWCRFTGLFWIWRRT